MKRKKMLFIGIGFLLGAFGGYAFQQDVIDEEGRLYPSKQEMCGEFIRSYLRTIQKTDNIDPRNIERWGMAIDIETEMYNLCILDLNKEALKNYKPRALEKYQK